MKINHRKNKNMFISIALRRVARLVNIFSIITVHNFNNNFSHKIVKTNFGDRSNIIIESVK